MGQERKSFVAHSVLGKDPNSALVQGSPVHLVHGPVVEPNKKKKSMKYFETKIGVCFFFLIRFYKLLAYTRATSLAEVLDTR